MNAADCQSLRKTFRLGFARNKLLTALNDVSFTLGEGEVLGLVGPNGSGKSTTLKILLDLVRPDAGSSSLFGVPSRNPTSRHRLGYVPETPLPFEFLTGHQFLELSGRLAGLSGTALRASITKNLELVGMGTFAHLGVRQYSKGMAQRITIASALLGEPRLLILDEPTSGLDPLGRRLVRDIIRAERAKGTAILFCTHILSDVENICDRVVLLAGGKVCHAGLVSDLTSVATTYEVVLEGSWGFAAKYPQATSLGESGGRATFELAARELQEFLRAATGAGSAIVNVSPRHLSLETILLGKIETPKVGGVVQ